MVQIIQYIYNFVIIIIRFYEYILIASVVLSWLLAFDMINTQNKIVKKIVYIIHRATDPVLMHLRRIVPTIGGIDFSPFVALFILGLIKIGFTQITGVLIRSIIS